MAFLDQGERRHNLARRAKAALKTVMVDESLLNRMQLFPLGETFDGRNVAAVGRSGKHHAGVYPPPIEMDGASATLAKIATLLRASQVKSLAQQFKQGDPWLEVETMLAAVDPQDNLQVVGKGKGSSWCRRARGVCIARDFHDRSTSRHRSGLQEFTSSPVRREEVGELAGISTEWYTWLEQGRDIRVSVEVLERIAQALRLDGAERTHLFQLARPDLSADPPTGDEVSPQLQRVLDRLYLCPAYILGRRWDFLAWNEAVVSLYGHLGTIPARHRNCLWLTFMDRRLRSMLVDWEPYAQQVIATFRSSSALFTGDPWFAELIADLNDSSPEFRNWWPRHEVQGWSEGRKRFEHPEVRALEFDHTAFQMADTACSGLTLVTYVPVPGSQTEDRLARLKVEL